MAVAITVVPSLAPPMKLVLLSIVVVPLASSGRLMTVAARADRIRKRHHRAAVNRVVQRAEIRPHQHLRDHAVLVRLR